MPSKEKHLQEVIERRRALADDCREALTGKSEIILEIGCGHGHFLTAFAQSHPERFCVGIDLISRRIRLANDKKTKRSLNNLLFIKAEGVEMLEAIPDSVRLECIFILFPDPWPKKRHHRRRLIQVEFLKKLANRTVAGGKLFFRTDSPEYFQWTAGKIAEHPDWEITEELAWPFETTTYFQELMDSFYSLTACRLQNQSRSIQAIETASAKTAKMRTV